jgi:hypothetical protein
MILQDLFEGRMKDIDIEYQDFLRSRGRNAMTDKQFQDAYGMTRVEWAKKNREWTQQKERLPVSPDAHLFHEENQDDRNARIIAGEIEDAMSQGNEQLVKQKIKELIGVGYTLNKDGKLQRMGMYEESQLQEKQDACYRKVKSRYKVWPSAYASGALVQCRKKGAANWGNKSKK